MRASQCERCGGCRLVWWCWLGRWISWRCGTMNGCRREQTGVCFTPTTRMSEWRNSPGSTQQREDKVLLDEPDIAERLVQGRLVCVEQTKRCEVVCVRLVVRKGPTSTRKRPCLNVYAVPFNLKVSKTLPNTKWKQLIPLCFSGSERKDVLLETQKLKLLR